MYRAYWANTHIAVKNQKAVSAYFLIPKLHIVLLGFGLNCRVDIASTCMVGKLQVHHLHHNINIVELLDRV